MSTDTTTNAAPTEGVMPPAQSAAPAPTDAAAPAPTSVEAAAPTAATPHGGHNPHDHQSHTHPNQHVQTHTKVAPHHAVDASLPTMHKVEYHLGNATPTDPAAKGEEGFLISYPNGGPKVLLDGAGHLVNNAIYTCPHDGGKYHMNFKAKDTTAVTAHEHGHAGHTHMNVSGTVNFNGHTTTATGGHGVNVHLADTVKTAVETAATPPQPPAPAVNPHKAGFTNYVANRPTVPSPMAIGAHA